MKNTAIFIVAGSLYLGSAITFIGPNNNDMTLYLILFCTVMLYLTRGLKIGQSFVVVGIFFILMGLGDFISYLIFTRLLSYDVAYVQSSIILTLACHLAGYAFVFLFLFVLKRKYFQYGFKTLRQLPLDLNTVLYTVAALTIIFANFIFIINTGGMASRVNLIYATLLFSFLILTLIFVLVSNRLKQEQRRNRQLEMYINTIDEISEELRRFKHNYLNILHGLSGYAELKEWGQLREYIDDLVAGSRKFKMQDIGMLQGIADPGLYGLLSAKIGVAESTGIEVNLNIDGEIGETIIKSHELYEVLGIFMDNAIEAVEDLEQKQIDIELKRDKGHVNINIANSIDDIPIPVAGLYRKGYSTKGDGRGSGLWWAQKILGRYKGVFHNTMFEEGYFTQGIVAPLKGKGHR
ncbi:MAG: GHKL domain-containing protein [Firmicutes bacterium]|nr:GHKL domain-containing protein [Bacillota bacterium]